MTKRTTIPPVIVEMPLKPTEAQYLQLVNLFGKHDGAVQWTIANCGTETKTSALRQMLQERLPTELQMKSALVDGLARVVNKLLRTDTIDMYGRKHYPVLLGMNAISYSEGVVSVCLLDGRERFTVSDKLRGLVDAGRLLEGKLVCQGNNNFVLSLKLTAPDFMRWVPADGEL